MPLHHVRFNARFGLLILAAAIPTACTLARHNSQINPHRLPNILIILADDLGYSDVACYNAEAKNLTPNIDRLAAQGMLFTDAHSPSTVCTPTRYSLLTGRMAFRTEFRGVFTSPGGASLIEEDRLTIGQMLRDKGYVTACIGKWHVGMTFLDDQGQPIYDAGVDAVQRIDFSRPIPDGPIHRGFDRFFGTACCPTTDWLYAYIDQDHIPVPPTRQFDRSTLPDHPYARDCRAGMIAPDFVMDMVDMRFLEESKAFLREHVHRRPDVPFFLFHSMQAVHQPSLVAPQFQGKSGMGPHGDFIMQMDWTVGELLATLDELGVADNTLVIFASDNGPEVSVVVNMRRDYGHDGAHPWRGMKRDQWEGGHRVPFIVRWPGRVPSGSRSDQLLSLTDLMATFAAIVDAQLPNNAAEDSYNMLPVLLGEQSDEPVRPYMLQQTNSLALSIRSGRWKYLDHRDSGGNRYDVEPLVQYTLPEVAPDAPGQLYDLETDPGETRNLYFERPEIVTKLRSLLQASVTSGRSTPQR